MTKIANIKARQILDSRGRPTVEADIWLNDGRVARASVPSGASTGKAEAVELRDGGEAWGGLGVSRAVASVMNDIAPALIGRDVCDQAGLDDQMREIDGTANLARLGGNATLAVSLAAVRASALVMGQPLFRRIAELAGVTPTMPMPMVNILSGGLHAGRGMDVQDFLMIPVGASSYAKALDWVCRVRLSATALCAEQGITTLLADEGGLSPGFESSEEALTLMVNAFERAGLEPGKDAAIALDIASSSLVNDAGNYPFVRQGRIYTASEMIALQKGWVANFPIVSIEDGLGEDDWNNWPAMTTALGQIQLVGDDLFATQPARIDRAVAAGICNAALIKVNQNGTFTGTLDAIRSARAGGYATVISARSGETEDDFLADLAVGVAGGQIKIGSVRNSERLSKYNQLLRLEEEGLDCSGMSGIAPL
jgi:enolase